MLYSLSCNPTSHNPSTQVIGNAMSIPAIPNEHVIAAVNAELATFAEHLRRRLQAKVLFLAAFENPKEEIRAEIVELIDKELGAPRFILANTLEEVRNSLVKSLGISIDNLFDEPE